MKSSRTYRHHAYYPRHIPSLDALLIAGAELLAAAHQAGDADAPAFLLALKMLGRGVRGRLKLERRGRVLRVPSRRVGGKSYTVRLDRACECPCWALEACWHQAMAEIVVAAYNAPQWAELDDLARWARSHPVKAGRTIGKRAA